MARDPLTSTTAGPASEIADYLAALDAALPGPRRARVAILDEIGDGLRAATDRHHDRGAPQAAAVRAALTEFGPPQAVAHAFAGELATARARRLLAALLLTGPLVGVWWLLLLVPHAWPLHPTDLLAAIPILPVVGTGVAVAVVVLAATGQLARWLPELSPRSTLRAGHVVAAACLAVDATMLGWLVIIGAGPGYPSAIVAAAAAASLLRLCWVGVAAGRQRRFATPLS